MESFLDQKSACGVFTLINRVFFKLFIKINIFFVILIFGPDISLGSEKKSMTLSSAQKVRSPEREEQLLRLVRVRNVSCTYRDLQYVHVQVHQSNVLV